MSSSNGVVRIARKGRRKFAFGEEGTPGSAPFTVDVVDVFHSWLGTYDQFRQEEEDESGERPIPRENREAYHAGAVQFVEALRNSPTDVRGEERYEEVSVAEAMDFMARLREAYDELVVFMQAKSRAKQDSPATSEEPSQLRFSVEPGQEPEKAAQS